MHATVYVRRETLFSVPLPLLRKGSIKGWWQLKGMMSCDPDL